MPISQAGILIFEHNIRKTFNELGFSSSQKFEELEEVDAQVLLAIVNAYGEGLDKKMKKDNPTRGRR